MKGIACAILTGTFFIAISIDKPAPGSEAFPASILLILLLATAIMMARE